MNMSAAPILTAQKFNRLLLRPASLTIKLWRRALISYAAARTDRHLDGVRAGEALGTRILLLCHSKGLGNALLSTAFAAALRRAYPESRLDIVSSEVVAPVYRGNAVVDGN